MGVLVEDKYDENGHEKRRSAGQILWIRGLTRLQTQIRVVNPFAKGLIRARWSVPIPHWRRCCSDRQLHQWLNDCRKLHPSTTPMLQVLLVSVNVIVKA